jgi:hypothetical protein
MSVVLLLHRSIKGIINALGFEGPGERWTMEDGEVM